MNYFEMEMERRMNDKLRCLLDRLDEAFEHLLKDLDGADRETLSKLRSCLDEFENIKTEVKNTTELSEERVRTLLNSSEEHIKAQFATLNRKFEEVLASRFPTGYAEGEVDKIVPQAVEKLIDEQNGNLITFDDIVHTIGDNKRKVISQSGLKETVKNHIKRIVEKPEFANILKWDNIHHKQFFDGVASENIGYWTTDFCEVKPNTQYVAWVHNLMYLTVVCFFDSDFNYLSKITNVNTFTTPENCFYIKISNRYRVNGTLTEYNENTIIKDDLIKHLIINEGTPENITKPYDFYMEENTKIKRNVGVTNKVVCIGDGKRETAKVEIDRSVFTGDIQIVVCGSNVFDGTTESGYYSGATKLASADHKRSVNPIYVNENDYVTFSKSCRVTEFDENGVVVTSNTATARIPYKTAYKTSYIHIHGLSGEMDNMYVNNGKHITNVPETYKCVTITETVRDWGSTMYNVEIPLYDGVNTIFVKSPTYANITLTYNPYDDNERKYIYDLFEKVSNINYMQGTKIANSERFVAHRGSTDAPENTYLAYVTAFLNGFKAIESDVRFTSDNVPLMLHDSTINRTSNGGGAVAEMTAETVQSFEFGSWKHKKFTGLQIPTFKNFIRFCWQFDIIPYIDIGGISATMTAEQTQILYDIVAYYGLQEKAIWCCGNFTPVDSLLSLYNATNYKMNFAYITNSETPIDSVITSLNWYKNTSNHNLGDVYLSIDYALITPEIERSAKDKNLKITAYIVNDVKDAQNLSAYRIDSMCTDNLDLPLAICNAIANVDWYK